MKLHNPIQNTIAVISFLVCSCCNNAYFSRSNIERAKAHQDEGRYEKAIKLASTAEAYLEDSKEASRLVSESTKAQMIKDLDRIWDGKLSDEEAKRKGYHITRYRTDNSEIEESR